MTTLKMLKDKLEGLRSSTGFLWAISIDNNGIISLETGWKVNDASNVSDDTEIIAAYDGSSI